jgi:tetratricopeptide (TPR) repeat protein
MPLVNGLSLERVIAFLHRRAYEPPPDFLRIPEDALDRVSLILQWFTGALEGLEHAHERGIIHRDIKPSNLILDTTTGRLRLTDFGLARAHHLTGLTQKGAMMGTVAYMAPEQVRGDPDRMDPRTDVYAMGVTLYRALLDRLPFSAATTAAYLDRILSASPQPTVLHRDLQTILFKSMEKLPAHRYSTARSLREDLVRFRHHEPIVARPVGVAGRLSRWARRKPSVAALVSVLVLSAAVVGVLVQANRRSAVTLAREEAKDIIVDARSASLEDDHPRALELYSRAIGLDPDNLDARMGRVMTILRLAASAADGDTNQALQDLQVGDRLKPDLSSVHRLRSRVLGLQGNVQEAERELDRSRRLPPRIADDFYFLGEIAYADRDWRGAADLLDEAIKREPRMAAAILLRGMCYFNRAGGGMPRRRTLSDREWQDYSVAERDARIASHLNPTNYKAHNNLANALTQLGRFEEALAAYERALQLSPENSIIHFNYGEALRSSGDLVNAEARFRRSLELDAHYSKTHNNLADVLAETGRYDEARSHYLEAIGIEEAREKGRDRTELGIAFTGLCDVALARRDLGEAARACEKAVSLEPDERDNHYNLAAFRMLSGDPKGALDSLERDVELGDTDYEYLLEDDTFEPLRGDRRFVALVNRMRARAGSSAVGLPGR